VIPLVLYAAAVVAYAWHFVERGRASGLAATTLLGAATIAHTFVIGMQTVEVGAAPFAGRSGAVSAFVWMLAIAYLYTELATGERAIGLFITPLLAALQVIPALADAPTTRPAVLDSPLFALHVGSMLFAYAAFALASVVGVTYVLLFRELKRRVPGVFFSHLPSLDILDAMNMRAVTIGWVCLTVGLLAGAWWLVEARVYAPADPRVQAMTLVDPKILVACLSWLIYSFLLFSRHAIGWSARRAAWLSALGFALVLLNFLPVTYFLSRSHDFA
jgi:ABC-type uncharacterized transport system permease subunit